ncbi:MAG: PEP-CTERM sorting domain-containing protein [Luteolibacter sp.]
MKMKTPLVAALLLGMPAISGAFTLDAVGYGGSELSLTPYSVFVPGYGELVFEAAAGSSLIVNSAYQNDNGFGGPSLSFDNGEAVKITFKGLEPLNVDFDFVGVSAGEDFVIEKDLVTPQAYLLSFKGAGDGAGLYAISWNTAAVPEPASALLGLMGGAFFAFRRRR